MAPNWKKILRGFNVTDPGFTVDRDGVEVEVVLAGTGVPYVRGRSSGPAEKCYPSEGGGCEDVTAYDSVTGEVVELTPEEIGRATEHLWNVLCEQDSPAGYDDDDRAYDSWKDSQMERYVEGT